MTKDSVKEDVRQYNSLLERYSKLNSEDYTGAYDISQKALILSDRWNEIQVNANKLDLGDLSKTDFQKWAYGRYRTMQLAHEHSRSIWRMGEQFARQNQYPEKGK